MKKTSVFSVTKTLKQCICIALFATTPAMAESVAANNSQVADAELSDNKRDIFKELNIPKHLPSLALSDLGQSSNFIEHMDKTFTVGDKVKQSNLFLVTSEDTKGNIKMKIKYNPNQLDGRRKVLEDLEKLALTEYKLRQHAAIYNPKSVKLSRNDKGQDVVSFNYSKYALPQDIAYFRFLQVELIVEQGQVKTMVISNNKSFKHHYGKVIQYRQEIEFDQLDNGEYVILSKQTNATGECKGKPCEMDITVTPVAFYHDDLGVVVKQEALYEQLSDPRIEEKDVKLHRVFPILGDAVKRRGIDTPLPYGISMAYRNQDMDVDFSSFSVFGLSPEFMGKFFDAEESHAQVNAESFSVRGDVYILPFWNVYGLLGKVDVNADVSARFNGIDQCLGVVIGDKCLGDKIEIPEFDLHVPLHLRYNVYGVGTTLSVGYRQFFASLTGTYTVTKLEGSDGEGGSLVTVQPMLGYQMPEYRAQFFVGAEYQGLGDTMDGTVVFGDVEMDYNVGVKVEQWAYLIGFNKQFGKHYNLTGILSAGEDRTAATLNFSYRF